ncbi:MAG: hypothetical protein M5U31_13450 [Acidimicrobiia bacterium]|nr:hypothetical protein [Acidimicrobiia bacterium]
MPDTDDSSTAAELSTVRSQVDELTERITACADRYASTPGSTVAAECYDAERSLIAARRAIERARAVLT